MEAHKIDTIDDLTDERSKELAKEYDIDVKWLVPLVEEYEKNNKAENRKKVTLEDYQHSLNPMRDEMKGAACCIILGYELMNNDRLFFEIPTASETKFSGSFCRTDTLITQVTYKKIYNNLVYENKIANQTRKLSLLKEMHELHLISYFNKDKE